MKFNEFMGQEKSVNRWFVFKIALIGAICGAALTAVYMFSAFGAN